MWSEIERHRAAFRDNGELARKRARQQIKWMWALLEERLLRQVLDHKSVKAAWRRSSGRSDGAR
jgi:LAO/AO transport system kinase